MKKNALLMIAKLFPCFLMIITLTSCEDDEVMPIVTNDMVEQMLNSVEISDITCVTAVAKGTGMSKKDMNRFYPKKDPYLSILYVPEDEYLQAIKDKNVSPEHEYPENWFQYYKNAFYPEHRYIEDWDQSNYSLQLTYLKPSTTYLYKATLTVDSVTFSGEVRRFTTASVDDYLWMNVIESGFKSSKLGGRSLLESVIGKSDYYFTFDNGLSFRKLATPTIINTDSLQIDLDSLKPGYTYNYQIQAVSNEGWVVTTPLHSFTTPQPSENIYVYQPTQITATSAFISGRIDPDFFDPEWIPWVIIEYTTDKNFQKDILHDSAMLENDGFGTTITRLSPSTTYYFKVGALWRYDQSTANWFYADTQSFTTSAE